MTNNDPPIRASCRTLLTIRRIMTEYRTNTDNAQDANLPENVLNSFGQEIFSLEATLKSIKL